MAAFPGAEIQNKRSLSTNRVYEVTTLTAKLSTNRPRTAEHFMNLLTPAIEEFMKVLEDDLKTISYGI